MSSLKNRCHICHKKIHLDFYTCKCNPELKLCSTHRYSFAHNCTISQLDLNKQKLLKENIVIKRSQLE